MKLTEISNQQITPEIREFLDQSVDGTYQITPNGIDVDGDVKIPKRYQSIPIQFHYVSGDFYCYGTNITSLQGAPLQGGKEIEQLAQLFNKHLETKDIMALQDELIDAGYKNIARL